MKEIGQALKESAARIGMVSDTPLLDAQVLISHLIRKPRAWVLSHNDIILSEAEETSLDELLNRLENGEPLPYILGHWEFLGLDFSLSPASLIPRPETELLVENALSWLELNPNRRLAVDIGTGSGCIAISLAVKIEDLKVFASDISLHTLRDARINAIQHGVSDQVQIIQSDLLPPIIHKFDLICANLPYIPSGLIEMLELSHREPGIALDGGKDGLLQIRRLLQSAPHKLSSGGLILIEIEASSGPGVHELARASFPDADVRILQDLAGFDRLIAVQSRL